MRILYFSNGYGATTTTFIRNEVAHFAGSEDVKYLCTELTGSRPDFVHVIPFHPNRVLRKINWHLWKADLKCSFYDPGYARLAGNFVSGFSPDVIHCHFAYEALTLLDNIAFSAYPVMLHFHGYDATRMAKKKSYLRRLKHLLQLPNVHAVSCNLFFAQRLAELLQIPVDTFEVLRYGIDLKKFTPAVEHANKEEKLLLQVSSLAPKKGHTYTIMAFAKLMRRWQGKLRLVLTGDGASKATLTALAGELGVADAITFTGMVSHEEARNLMQQADVFVHHSITADDGDMEGIPNAIIEAMAMELPVVSTYHSGIPELVEDGVNGYLVKEKDIDAYVEKMEAALKLGRLKQNRLKVEALHNLKKHNQQLAEIYKTAIAANMK